MKGRIMNKLIFTLVAALGLSTSAAAYDNHRHNHRHNHHSHRGDWVGPALGGVLIGIAVSRAGEQSRPPVIIERQPVPIDQPPVYRLPSSYQTFPCLIPYIDPVTGHKRHEYVLCVR